MSAKTRSATSTRKNIIATIKGAPAKRTRKKPDHPLQWKGSYMKEDAVNKALLQSLATGSIRPLNWFIALINQVICAASPNGFCGVLEVVNEAHAKKLETAQEQGYYFATITAIGRKLEIAQQAVQVPAVPEVSQEQAFAAAKNALAQYRMAKDWGSHSILVEVIELFTSDNFKANTFRFAFYLQKLLTTLARPAVSQAVGQHLKQPEINGIVDMLVKLQEFCDNLQEEHNATLVEHEWLERYAEAEDLLTEDWQETADMYNSKLHAVLVETGRATITPLSVNA